MEIYNHDGMIDADIKDILYELGNAGLGSASIIMGKILGVRLNIGVPDVFSIEDMNNDQIFHNDPGDKVAVILQFQNSLDGLAVLIVNKEFADANVSKAKLDDDVEVDEIMQEYGNLIMAAYFKAMSQYTGVRIYVKPVDLKYGTESNILNTILKKIDKMGYDKMICVDTSFLIRYEDGSEMDNAGRVLLFPNEESVKTLTKELVD